MEKVNKFKFQLQGFRYNKKKAKWVNFDDGIVFPSKRTKKNLKIITWNVLFDKFIEDENYNQLRNKSFIKEIEEENADIISLQEVRKNFWEDVIMGSEFIQKKYTISANGESKIFEDNGFGNAILSKIPFNKLEMYTFSKYKSFVLGTFSFEKFGNLTIANIHLSANFHQRKKINNSKKRLTQINRVRGYLKEAGCINQIINGDFNFGDEKESNTENKYIENNFVEFKDIWKELKGDDTGFTFNTEKNPTALMTTEEKKQKRLDKIMLNSLILKPISIKLVGTKIYSYEDKTGKKIEYCCSDHFGLATKLKIAI